MPSFNNLFNNKSTTAGSILASITNNPLVATGVGNALVDPGVDATWGGATAGFSGPDSSISPYFDYYFSGQDINVSIDGTSGNGNFATLPIISLAFQMTQPKLAIYGFWSYTYDAMAYGARQIAARMEIATTYPGYMTDLLQEVAKERMDTTNSAYASSAPLSTDDQNILTFWCGGAATEQTGTTLNLYQEHPPFDMIIIYGNQATSVSNPAAVVWETAGNNPLFVDINERLIESNAGNIGKRIILESCEITSMSTQYTTSGEVICETYDLVINDISIPA